MVSLPLLTAIAICVFLHTTKAYKIQTVDGLTLSSTTTSSPDIQFHHRVTDTINHIKLFLADAKLFNPFTAITSESQPTHEYADNYYLTQSLTNLALNSIMNVFTSSLGMTSSHMDTISSWIQTRSEVSMVISINNVVEFKEEISRLVENPSSTVETTETTGNMFATKRTTRGYTSVKEFKYAYSFKYSIKVVRGLGVGSEDTLLISQRSIAQDVVMGAKLPDALQVFPDQDMPVNLSWLFQHMSKDVDGEHYLVFDIDRSAPNCVSPVNNANIQQATTQLANINAWTTSVMAMLNAQIFDVKSRFLPDGNDSAALIHKLKVFSPVLPLLELTSDSASNDLPSSDFPSKTAYLRNTTLDALLGEHKRSLLDKKTKLTSLFTDKTFVNVQDALMLSSVSHLNEISLHFAQGLDMVDLMVSSLLIASIGKYIEPSDFSAYMQFHFRRLLKTQYQLSPFSHSIRRSLAHSPEGTLRIEDAESYESVTPIQTMHRSVVAEIGMEFPLSASSKVTFKGHRHLHMLLTHSFSQSPPQQLKLIAQAKQFSSFILLAGRVISHTEFEPLYGIIVKNKDELSIPLNLAMVPTAKEFRSAIQSLSVQQQDFAKAIRNMQLGGTVFGLVVIQIKPHMEQVLNLEPDSLTKEIALSEDLMDMFIKYQIPSDLLSFDGKENVSSHDRVNVVRSYVKGIKDMILKAKETEVIEKKMLDEMNKREKVMPMMESMHMGEGASRLRSASPPQAPMTPMSDVSEESAMKEPTTPVTPKDSVKAVLETSDVLKLDYSQVPSLLDLAHDKYDPDSPLRSTVITASDSWTLKSKKGLLHPVIDSFLDGDALNKAKNDAFDLLDALSKSGSIELNHAELHIVYAATHAFDKSVMDTVVKDNSNPIERAERSMLIMASTLHGLPTSELIDIEHVTRLQRASPALFLADGLPKRT